MRFSANVSILFQEVPPLDRFSRAKSAGFQTVEFWWPSGEDLREVERAVRDAGLDVALFNFDAGDLLKQDRGLLSDPARQARFREHVPIALALASRLGCKRLNALVGLRLPGLSHEEQMKLARENVRWAADRAAERGATVLIEALNTLENGPYLLHSTQQASEFVRAVGRENVKLQCDVYHMQRMEETPTATLRRHIGEIGHVQIADSPDRGEPGTGEIDFPAVFSELETLGYRGYVGLEYRPSTGDTEESFRWLPREARSGDVDAGSLNLPGSRDDQEVR